MNTQCYDPFVWTPGTKSSGNALAELIPSPRGSIGEGPCPRNPPPVNPRNRGRPSCWNNRIEITALNCDGHEFPVELTSGRSARSEGVALFQWVRARHTRRKAAEGIRFVAKNQDLETLLYVRLTTCASRCGPSRFLPTRLRSAYAPRQARNANGQYFLGPVGAGGRIGSTGLRRRATLSRVGSAHRGQTERETSIRGKWSRIVPATPRPRIRETQAVGTGGRGCRPSSSTAAGQPRRCRTWCRTLEIHGRRGVRRKWKSGFRGPEGVDWLWAGRGGIDFLRE